MAWIHVALVHPHGIMISIYLEQEVTMTTAKQIVLFLLSQNADSRPENRRISFTLDGMLVKQVEQACHEIRHTHNGPAATNKMSSGFV